jgi:hypothetical protein
VTYVDPNPVMALLQPTPPGSKKEARAPVVQQQQGQPDQGTK